MFNVYTKILWKNICTLYTNNLITINNKCIHFLYVLDTQGQNIILESCMDLDIR